MFSTFSFNFEENKLRFSNSNQKRYINFFNQKSYSDFVIKLKEEDIFCHKIILMSISKFFLEEIEKGSEKYKYDEEINEKEFLKFLKFFYEDNITFESENELINFLKLSEKVKIISLTY